MTKTATLDTLIATWYGNCMKHMTVAEFVATVKPGQCLVMRGAPGSGKGTLVEAVRTAANLDGRVFVASADYHRMIDGVYTFDASKNDRAHAACLRDFISFADSTDPSFGSGYPDHRKDVLVCDNTNINVQEIAPYYAVAKAFGWDPLVVTVQTDPEIAAKRNRHAVPAAHVHHMADRIGRFQLPGNYRQVVVETEG